MLTTPNVHIIASATMILSQTMKLFVYWKVDSDITLESKHPSFMFHSSRVEDGAKRLNQRPETRRWDVENHVLSLLFSAMFCRESTQAWCLDQAALPWRDERSAAVVVHFAGRHAPDTIDHHPFSSQRKL